MPYFLLSVARGAEQVVLIPPTAKGEAMKLGLPQPRNKH